LAAESLPNARAVGYDVVCNRPKVAAYRAPGSPMGAFAVESVLDVLAQKIGMDPLRLRLKNAAKKGTQMLSGATLSHNGYAETIEALLNHPGYTAAPLGKNQRRGIAELGGEAGRHHAGVHRRRGDDRPAGLRPLGGNLPERQRLEIADVCSGPGSLNRFSASLSGVSAGVRLPCGWAAG
jgi:hypothetical protein